MSQTIQTADLDWQLVDGIDIPVSKIFGDVYFSKANGLLETRHVFIQGNDLPERLENLKPFESFIVGETGFGTGLNILTLWQQWQQVRPNNHSHLHAISVEKYPLSKTDLIRALKAWPELKDLADQLIEQYPLPIAGCHRLSFPNERFSLDLWLGDAHDVFPVIPKTAAVNAWFLDGFAPACNPDMWEEKVLNQIMRLSEFGTTFASFSVAGILKRGLKQHGVSITRPKGFGRKREMLKGIWSQTEQPLESTFSNSEENSTPTQNPHFQPQRQIGVIGAGIAGLSCAYALAQRGHKVRLFDQTAPLSGASGNPLALLNPKLCPIEQSADHLMTLAWQHALNFYRQFNAFQSIQVQQIPLKNPQDLLSLATQYPSGVLEVNSENDHDLAESVDHLQLNYAGTVFPHLLAEEILQNKNIDLNNAKITAWEKLTDQKIRLSDHQNQSYDFDQVIVCGGPHSTALFDDFPILKPIRGQVSWFDFKSPQLRLKSAYSYGGYCAPLNTEQMIIGASFYPNRGDHDVLVEDHQHNFKLIADVLPKLANQLPDMSEWQGRASVRAQSLDYFPLLGRVDADAEIYTFAGLGSKGFLYSPLCSEILVAQMLGHACPAPQSLVDKLNVNRFKKKVKAKKPYFRNKTDE